MKYLLNALIASVFTLAVVSSCFAFEYSVNCGMPVDSYPAAQVTGANQDASSRYVFIAVKWNSMPKSLALAQFGMEFKAYHYNYNEAAPNGKGPAYVTSPSGFYRCDVPGCYLDSDFASDKNAVGEYNEPQVAFGIAPEYGSNLQTNYDYYMVTRAVSGRGNKSLLKARNYLTKRISQTLGVSGIFLCGDVAAQNVISFQDRVFSPTCIRTNPATHVHQSCI